MMPKVKSLIENKDYVGLDRLLTGHPELANKGITIPFDFLCRIEAHPLHRICDTVMAGKLTDDEAVRFAIIFLEHGSVVDGDKMVDGGTPLLAAASLHAEKVGILYIENWADIHYTFRNDGASALHWAAFCGLDRLAERLINAGAKIDQPDNEHNSTPMGWAIHSLMSNDRINRRNQISCIKLLLAAGADAGKLDMEKAEFLQKLSKEHAEILNVL